MRRTRFCAVFGTGAALAWSWAWGGTAEKASAAAATHAQLRNATATACFTPESHLRLARYHYDMGHGVQAVYLAEYARRLFGDTVFLVFFKDLAAVRLTEPTRFKDETERMAYCKTHPDSAEAYARDLEDVLRGPDLRVENAEELLGMAFAKYPHQLALKMLAASYYAKTLKDQEKALPLYVELYFHNPRFDDGMGVADRIGKICASLRKTWWETRKRSGTPLVRLVAEEENPEVLEAFLAETCGAWNPAMATPVLALLEKDDPVLQTRALAVLSMHPRDVPIAATVKAMQEGDDLVKRSLAPFLIVNVLGEGSYPLLDADLDSGIELVQANAVRALAQMGGAAGLAYLRRHPLKKAGFHAERIWLEEVARGSGAATNSLPQAKWMP